MTGKIVRVTDRGFGFIRLASGKDVFVHASGVVGMRFDDLQPGDTVTFDVEQHDGRERAVNVRGAR